VPAGLDPDGRLALDTLQDSIEVYRAAGVLSEAIDAASAVDPQYAEFARERLGPYRP